MFFPQLNAQQIKSLPDDHETFIEEFINMMSVRISDKNQAPLDEFTAYYRSGAFSDEEKDNIIALSNMMLERRARPYPHFMEFIISLSTFKKTALSADEFNAWKNGLFDLLEDSKYSLNRINTFLEMSHLAKADGVLYRSRTLSWQTEAQQIKMVYDSSLSFICKDVILKCYSQRDSLVIYQTSGIYDPSSQMWKGKQGKVDWKRAGFNENEIYALLSNYSIDMTKSHYSADSVVFTHPSYFPDGEKGVLMDRAKVTSSPDRASFPVFESYENRLYIKNIFPDIDYEGGLQVFGASVKGTGDEYEPAKIRIYKNDSLKMLVNTSSILIKGKSLISKQASISLYIENDSIFHPNIGFNYKLDKREVSLFQTDNILTSAPYFNSYHMIDMKFDQLVWKLDDPVIRLSYSRGSSQGQAWFTSSSYYNENYYFKMQALDEIHPLFLLKKFSEWYYSDEFPISELADWMGKPQYQIEHLVTRMALDGFVFYTPETGMVTIKQTLINYLAANGGNIDYDVINFFSSVRAPMDNARLNLETNDLTIYGIPGVSISDSQNVDIIPSNNRIILKKNRDFDFSGKVQAGMLSFYGDGFTFRYDSFKINLHNIDSLNMLILGEETDDYGNLLAVKVHNNIENITGELLIDHPLNKSGLENFEDFPSFESTAKSFVFYDITVGMDSTVYDKDVFYYQLNPFILHDLTKLEREDLRFDGEFHAGSVFPVLHDDLAVQEDLSLGFRHSTNTEGIEVYNGLATYYDEIILSNNGIEGKGKLVFMNSTTYSDNFRFHPDSMMADANNFMIEKDSLDPKFPYVSGHDNRIKWYPSKDEWYCYKKDENLNIFNDDIEFSGNLIMSSKGINGTGTIYIEDAEIQSTDIQYSDISFQADSSNLKIRTEDRKGYSIVADQVSANVNIKEQSGIFQSYNDTVPLLFPEKNYISAVDLLMWDMASNKINMINQDPRNDAYKLGSYYNEDSWTKSPTFVSMNPRTDTIGFASDSAVYKLDDHVLTAYYVDFLEIADAHIFPGDKSLSLERTGFMKGFSNARIIANGKHKIIADEIHVLSKSNYYGSGFYDYIDKNKNSQRIKLGDIKINKAGFTYAQGEISIPDSFMLSPHFWFDGRVILDAENELLHFSGGVKLNHVCDSISRNRIRFSADIDPDNVMIPISEKTKTPDAKSLYKGIYITSMFPEFYTAFFSPRRSYSDQAVSTAHGYLIFDEKTGSYKLGSREKLMDHSLPGSLLTLKKSNCKSYGEGKLDLAIELHQVKLTCVGNIVNDTEKNETRLDVLLGLDFFFSEEALQIMAEEINSKPTLKAVNMSARVYNHGINELLGMSQAQKHKNESMLIGSIGEIPSSLSHSLMLSKLELKWNKDLQSYVSEGQIGIGNINGKPVNRLLDAYVEIQKKRSGDILDIYLKLDNNSWYYFGYTRGVMQAYSSNPDFLDLLVSTSNKQRTMNVKSGEVSYIYMVASDRKLSNFRKRMRMVQNGEQAVEDTGDEAGQ